MKCRSIALLAALGLTAPALAQNDDLLEMLQVIERGFWDAHAAEDRAYFEANLSVDAIDVAGTGVTVGKAAIIDRIFGCDVVDYELSGFEIHPVRNDIAILTFEAAYSGTCGGASVEQKVVVSSTYVQRDGKWLNVAYQESPATGD